MTSHRTLSPCNISESTSTNTVSVTWTNVYCFHRGQWQYYLDSMYTITCCYVRGISAFSKKMFWFWAPNFTGISKKGCSLNQLNPVPTAAVLPTEVASTYQEWYDYLTKQRTTWIFNPPPPPPLLTHCWSVDEDDRDHSTNSGLHIARICFLQFNSRCVDNRGRILLYYELASARTWIISSWWPFHIDAFNLPYQKSEAFDATYVSSAVDQKNISASNRREFNILL